MQVLKFEIEILFFKPAFHIRFLYFSFICVWRFKAFDHQNLSDYYLTVISGLTFFFFLHFGKFCQEFVSRENSVQTVKKE